MLGRTRDPKEVLAYVRSQAYIDESKVEWSLDVAQVYIVEVLAIYELPGVNPSQQRTNQRNQDLADAANTADKYEPGGVPPEDEYLTETAPKYGFGWQARQFVTVRLTGTNLGGLIFNQLSTRSLQAGSKVLVFADNREDGGGTEPPLYQRFWPRGNPPYPDIG